MKGTDVDSISIASPHTQRGRDAIECSRRGCVGRDELPCIPLFRRFTVCRTSDSYAEECGTENEHSRDTVMCTDIAGRLVPGDVVRLVQVAA